MKNETNYWTKSRCHHEALKYKTRKEFQLGGYPYQAARIHKWLDEICIHMVQKRIPNGSMTKEQCHIVAFKYKTRKEFKINEPLIMNYAYRHNFLAEICQHMNFPNGMNKKSKDHWVKERCKEEALKYNMRNDFRKNNQIAYKIALKNEWLDEICLHMKTVGNLYKRCIYAYEFSDNNVYVGLTYNLETRHKFHKERGPVRQHTIKISVNPILKQLTKYVHVDEAKSLEGEFLKKYKNNGWLILNKKKPGGIGGGLKWTKAKCHAEALKYKSRNNFCKGSSGAYSASIRNEWYDEVCSHMIRLVKPTGYWTKQQCQKEATKYESRKEFYSTNINCYNACIRGKWIDEVCSHMTKKWMRLAA